MAEGGEMTEGISPKSPEFPRDPIDHSFESDEKAAKSSASRVDKTVAEVGLRALGGAGGASPSGSEYAKLIELGCPESEAVKLLGRGYIEEYERHFMRTSQPAAEALLVLMISQDILIDKELRDRITPDISEGGSGGVYFLKNFRGEKVFVFKPQDEEAFMPAWPKSAVYSEFNPAEENYPVRLSIRKGSGSRNEAIGAQVSKLFGIDVPDTYLVDPVLLVHENRGVLYRQRKDESGLPLRVRPVRKMGSLQEYKPGEALNASLRLIQVVRYYGLFYGGLQKSFEVLSRIILFDCICGNADRNLGNALYDREGKKIYLIDHGLCFPDGLSLSALERRGYLTNETTFRLPMPSEDEKMSPELQEFCAALDILKLEELLYAGGAEKSSIMEMKMRVILVKALANRGIHPNGILDYFRQREENNSPVEIIANRALAALGIEEHRLKEMPRDEKATLEAEYLKEFERQIPIFLEASS